MDLSRTPAQAASAAAEEIRALNHIMYNGFKEPADAYATVGALSRLVSMLPQAVKMIGNAVGALETRGGLRSDTDTLPDDLAGTYDALRLAVAESNALYRQLDFAHQALGRIGTELREEDDDSLHQ